MVEELSEESNSEKRPVVEDPSLDTLIFCDLVAKACRTSIKQPEFEEDQSINQSIN